MQINLINPEDLDGIARITPKGWSDIRPYFQGYLDAPYCDAFKVMDRDEMVGAGAIIRHHSTAWLAHILVSEKHRGRGIGKFLIQALIDRIDLLKYSSILLIATDLGEPVYRRLGFEVEMEYAVFKWTEGRFLQPRHTLTAYNKQWEAPLLELDQWVSGEQRRNTLLEHLPKAKLITDGSTLLGAYLPTLGDGLVIARDPSVGQLFLRVRMGEKTNALMPATNAQAISAMKKQGLNPHTYVKRMVLGKPHVWNPAGLYNRIGGNLG